MVLASWILVNVIAMVLSYAAYNTTTTEMTVSEAVQVLEDAEGNTLTITKIEE